MPQVKCRRDGNLLRIFPITRKLFGLLSNELTYTCKKYLATYEQRKENRGRFMELTDVECFLVRKYDGVKHLVTPFGYWTRIRKLLKKNGYETEYQDLTPDGSRVQAFKPYWDRIKHIRLRGEKQRFMLRRMLEEERGQYCFPTGAGKSFLGQLLPQLLVKARVLITTKHQEPLLDWYNELRRHVADVGIWCSRKQKNWGARVMCVSAGSLARARDLNPHYVVVDEAHELATPHYLPKLRLFPQAKMLALSANYRDRMDEADFELEGLFGPLVASMTYDEAVEAGLIVPIEVMWRTVRLKKAPFVDLDGVLLKKVGLWRNRTRNRMIVEDAQHFEEEQVLITVKTVEHGLRLQRMLPGYELVYSKLSENRRKQLVKLGLLQPHDLPMTDNQRLQCKLDFENGALKKAIATTVWNRGVNFHRLQVLIRADGGASRIDATQIPGRLSRLCSLIGKQCGLLLDYDDQFHERLEENSAARRRTYKRLGWKQTNRTGNEFESVSSVA